MSGNEKRVLTKVFGPKEEEVKGDQRKAHNREFHDLCITNVYSDDQITDGDTGVGVWDAWGKREIHIATAKETAWKT